MRRLKKALFALIIIVDWTRSKQGFKYLMIRFLLHIRRTLFGHLWYIRRVCKELLKASVNAFGYMVLFPFVTLILIAQSGKAMKYFWYQSYYMTINYRPLLFINYYYALKRCLFYRFKKTSEKIPRLQDQDRYMSS